MNPFRLLAAVTALTLFAAPALAQTQTFPLTIEHKFGTTVIGQKPERIASLDYSGADNLLALGADLVAVRYWFGDYPRAVWPWADPLLQRDPEILEGDLNFEQVALSEPDVIIAIASGITQADYDKLSLIAPVVAVPEGKGDYELSWQERALLAGKAIGAQAEAEKQVATIKARLAEVASNHPDWKGKTATIALANASGQPGAYTSYDVRAQVLSDMGFVTPKSVDEVLEDEYAFYVYFSPEDIGRLESDLLVWRSTTGSWDEVRELTGRELLGASREGRAIFIGPLISGAFSHASLLSLPFAIENIVPMIEAALDGDPQTHADERPADFMTDTAQ